MKQSLQLLAVGAIFFALGFFIARTLSGTDNKPVQNQSVEDFSLFVRDFHSDPVFQKQRTHFPLLYITPSPQEGALADTFLIESAQWLPFTMLDSVGTLLTVSPEFCESGVPPPCRYTVTIQGMHHGEDVKFSFEDHHGQWFLYAFEDFSM